MLCRLICGRSRNRAQLGIGGGYCGRAYSSGPVTIPWRDILGTPADLTDFASWNQQAMDAVRELVVEKITLIAVCRNHLLLAWALDREVSFYP